MGLVGKTTTLHVHLTFLYISLPFLHDYDVKLPNFTFSGGRIRPRRNFIIFLNLNVVLRNSTPGGFAYIWQSKWVGIIAMKTERMQVHFWSDVFAAVASSDRKVPTSKTFDWNRQQFSMVYTVFTSFLMDHEKLLSATFVERKILIDDTILVSFNYLTHLMVHWN